MRSKRVVLYVGAGAIVGLALQGPDTSAAAQAQADVRALYERSASLGDRTNNRVFNVVDAGSLAWVTGSPQLTYRKSVKGGNEFVLVDPAAKTKAAPFDHAKLAAGLSTANNAKYTAQTLPFTTFTFVDNRQAIEFTLGGGGGAGRGGGGGGGGRGGAPAGGPAAPRW
jgi:hypothetical protein